MRYTFLDIPNEILLIIFEYINPKDLLVCMLTAKQWQGLIDDEQQWLKRIKRELTLKPQLREERKFKTFYTSFYEIQYYRYKPYITQSIGMAGSYETNAEGKKEWVKKEATLNDYLVSACERNAEVWAQRLLKQGAKPTACALEHAITNNNLFLVDVLLKQGGPVNGFKEFDSEATLIHFAAETSITLLRRLLQEYDAITAIPALHKAIAAGRQEDAMRLLRDKGLLNQPDCYGCKPIWWAMVADNCWAFELLIAEGAELQEVCGGLSALYIAVDQMKEHYLEILLAVGMSVNEIYLRTRKDNYYNHEKEQVSLLTIAIEKGWVQGVKSLLDKGATIDEGAVLAAAAQDNVAILKMLLEKDKLININRLYTSKDKDHNSKSIHSHSLLYKAISELRPDSVEYLLKEKGANPNQPSKNAYQFDGTTEWRSHSCYPLETAIDRILYGLINVHCSEHERLYDELYNDGLAVLNNPNNFFYKRLKIITLLLQYGADINFKQGHHSYLIDTLTEVLCKEAPIEDFYRDADDEYKNTVNQYYKQILVKCLDIMLDYKAKVDIELHISSYSEAEGRKQYSIPLINHIAEKGLVDAAKILIEKGNANIEQIDPSNGNTPVIEAARNGHLAMVEYLYEKNADLTAMNKAGETALDSAKMHGYQHIVDFIEAKLNDAIKPKFK